MTDEEELKEKLELLLQKVDEKQELVDALEIKLLAARKNVKTAPRSVRFNAETVEQQKAKDDENETERVDDPRAKLSAERRQQHALAEKLLHKKRHLIEGIEDANETTNRNIELTEALQAEVENSQKFLEMMKTENTKEKLENIIEKINNVEKMISIIDGEMSQLDTKREKLRRIEAAAGEQEPISDRLPEIEKEKAKWRARNDKLRKSIAVLNGRFRRLRPLALKWRDERLLANDTDNTAGLSIDQLLDLVASRTAKITTISDSETEKVALIEETQAELFNQLQELESSELQLKSEIAKQRQKNFDMEKSLVEEIRTLRVRIAAQKLRKLQSKQNLS